MIMTIVLLLAALIYLSPSLLALAAHHPRPADVLAINTMLGLTGIGWLFALSMAVGHRARHDAKRRKPSFV